MDTRCDTDVAIVGAGPVGTYLANLLGRAGRRVVLVDREPEINTLPRAVHFDGEVMRAFQAIGLEDEIGRTTRASAKGMHFVSSTGQTLMIRKAYEGVGPHGWAYNYYMHQPFLETVLREGLERYPNVVQRLGAEVSAIAEDASGATLTLTDMASGNSGVVRAAWVVGCDGARSFVRRLIGIDSEDLGLHQPWLVVDVIVDPTSARVQALPEHTIQLCDPDRPMTIVYVGGQRRRWEIMLMPGDDPASMVEPERVWSLISRWLSPEDGRLERAALYTFHSIIANAWRRGRLMLAGDSCHQTPPFLGQGMCAGIRDAMNLAWKLVAVLDGRSDPELLETYGSERRPHVRAFIGLAVELGAIIQATDPEVARKRDQSFEAETPRMFDYPQPQLGPGVWMEGPAPHGQVFPQPRLDDGRRLDDVTRGRFALLGAQRLLSEIARAQADRIAALDLVVVDQPSQAIDAWLERYGVEAVLIRPDAYVFGTMRSREEIATGLAALEQRLHMHPLSRA